MAHINTIIPETLDPLQFADPQMMHSFALHTNLSHLDKQHLSENAIKARADFKVLLLTYKALHGLATTYLSELVLPYIPTVTRRRPPNCP